VSSCEKGLSGQGWLTQDNPLKVEYVLDIPDLVDDNIRILMDNLEGKQNE
jgi:hypothetical protein